MNGKWPISTFGTAPFQIIDGDRGKNYPKQDEFFEDGYCLFLNANNVTDHGFNFSKCQFISEEKDRILRKGKLTRNDVVLTTRGTLGNVGLFNQDIPYENIRINSGMVVLRTEENKLSSSFLYYFLRSKLFKEQVNSLRSGVAQPQLPIRDMKAIKIPIPPVHEQRAIADFLSNYDKMILNNNRRIQLLDRSARLIFKEWFIHLRFPGRELNKVVNGIPEGWVRQSLGELVTLNYGKGLNKDERVPGPFPVYGSSGIIGTHEKAIVSGPGIILGRKGNVGSVFWSTSDFYPIDTVYYISSDESNLFLYYALLNANFMSTDVAVPGLNRNLAYSTKILAPEPIVLGMFEEYATFIYKLMTVLQKQCDMLSKARDYFLPRLMNGEIPL